MKIAERWAALARHSPLAILLDFDGTLVPLAARPELALPPASLIALLGDLAALPGVVAAVVSGRPRADLERWFGRVPRLWLAAEHGAFLRGTGGWTPAEPGSEHDLAEIEGVLRSVVDGTPGALLEVKSRTIAVHHRSVPAAARPPFIAAVDAALGSWLERNPTHERLDGSSVIEVRRSADRKSRVVAPVRHALGPGARILAIGDDVTDEDLFRALGPTDEAVRIGVGAGTAARWLLDGPSEVIALLEWIRDVRRGVAAGEPPRDLRSAVG